MDKQTLIAAGAAVALTIGDKVTGWASAVADLAVYGTAAGAPEHIQAAAHTVYHGLAYVPLLLVGAYLTLRAKRAEPAPVPTTSEGETHV